MEDNKNKDGFDTSGIIENTAGRRRKLTTYTPPPAPVENPPEDIPDVVPETETPETVESVEPMKEKDFPKESEPPREEPRRRKTKTEPQDYEALFFKESATKTRSGKVVYIRKEYHDRIMKIVRVIGENEFSLFSYLDNVLEHHFNTFQNEITETYNRKNTDVF